MKLPSCARVCFERAKIASLKNYFSCVSVENYVAALFKPTSPERGKKTVKRPVGRTRKRPLESDGQALADNRELENIQAAPVHGEEPSVKSIRRQYTENKRSALFCTLDTTEFVPLKGSSAFREETSSGG